jgi:hypothetical protein
VSVVLALLLLAHGFAHLVGFVGPWKIGKPEQRQPYTTTLLAGRLDVGDAGIRVVGILWLLAAVAFGVLALAVLTEAPWWRPAAIWIASYSLVLSILGLPASWIGIAVDIILLAYVLFAHQLALLLAGNA